MNVKLVCEFLLMMCFVRSLSGVAIVKRQIPLQFGMLGEDFGEPSEWGDGGVPFGPRFAANPTNLGSFMSLPAQTNIADPLAPGSQQARSWGQRGDPFLRRFWDNRAMTPANQERRWLGERGNNFRRRAGTTGTSSNPSVQTNPVAPVGQERRRWGERGNNFRRRFWVNDRAGTSGASSNPPVQTNPVAPAGQERRRWGERGDNFRRRFWLNGRAGNPGASSNPSVQTNPLVQAGQDVLASLQAQVNSAGRAAQAPPGQVQLAALNAPEPPAASRSSVLVVM